MFFVFKKSTPHRFYTVRTHDPKYALTDSHLLCMYCHTYIYINIYIYTHTAILRVPDTRESETAS